MIRAWNLESGNIVVMLSVKRKEGEGDGAKPLDATDSTLYRPTAIRGAYFSQDRIDIQESIKECPRTMQNPTDFDMQLKMVGRYLKGKPWVVNRYEIQEAGVSLVVTVD